jgi:hypothetical protein
MHLEGSAMHLEGSVLLYGSCCAAESSPGMLTSLKAILMAEDEAMRVAGAKAAAHTSEARTATNLNIVAGWLRKMNV